LASSVKDAYSVGREARPSASWYSTPVPRTLCSTGPVPLLDVMVHRCRASSYASTGGGLEKQPCVAVHVHVHSGGHAAVCWTAQAEDDAEKDEVEDEVEDEVKVEVEVEVEDKGAVQQAAHVLGVRAYVGRPAASSRSVRANTMLGRVVSTSVSG